MLLLPARAIGDTNLTIRQTWKRSHGNVLRIFFGLLTCTIPPALVAVIVQALLYLAIATFVAREHQGGIFFAQMDLYNNMLFELWCLLILPIGIGFLSHAYRHFFGDASSETEGVT
jgi:hypothetical protein